MRPKDIFGPATFVGQMADQAVACAEEKEKASSKDINMDRKAKCLAAYPVSVAFSERI